MRRHRDAVLAVTVFYLACLPFLEATKFRFVAWDDDQGLILNPHWHGLGFEHLRWMFTTFTLGHWQPLAWLSFGLEYALWGVDPQRMHALNVALHACVAALFYLVARRVLPRESIWPAFLAALVFALHPLRVESAAWITERGHLLATVFALASVLAWLKGTQGSPSTGWKLAAIALFALSLMSKAWGITLPFVLVIIDALPKATRRITGSPARAALQQLREKAPFFLLAAAAMAIELVAKQEHVEMATFEEHGLFARASQAGSVVLSTLEKTLWPAGLAPLYEFRPGVDAPGAFALVGILGVTVVLWLARASLPGLCAAWLACLVLLAPVSGLAQAGLQRFADRYAYLAAMPLSLCIGAALALAAGRLSTRSARVVLGTGIGALLLALGVASARQVRVWRDSETLWRRVVSVDPRSFVGWHNLGTTLHLAGKIPEAVDAERKSVALEPGARNTQAWFHLGQLEWLYGDRERGKRAWSTALRLDPDDLGYLDWFASTQAGSEERRKLWTFALEAAPENALVKSRLDRLR